MKKLLLFVPLFVFADVHKGELKHISNRAEIWESEIKFLEGRVSVMHKSAQAWRQFLNERLDLLNKIEAQVNCLKNKENKKQKLVAAEFRLNRYLKVLRLRIGDWKKGFKKERKELQFYIDKFCFEKKFNKLDRDIKYLQEELGCSVELEDVEKNKTRLEALRPRFVELKKNVAVNNKKVDRYAEQFNLASDKVALVTKNNGKQFCCFLS